MNRILMWSYIIAIVGFALASVLMVLFYRRYFAAKSLPVEWRSMYVGIGVMSISSTLFFAYEITGSRFVLELASLSSLLAGVMMLDASYVLWRRFML